MSEAARNETSFQGQDALERAAAPWRALKIDTATAALCASLVVARLIALGCFSVFDDAFITFRYARNFATGHGLVYNAGEWVLGTTAPLFALLASAIVALGGAPELWLPWINIAVDVAIALLVQRLVFAEDRAGFAVFVGCFALSPMLARVSVGAMEVDLFMLCGLGALALYRGARRFLAVALGAAAYFLRPEAVLVVAVLCLAEMIIARRPWRAIGMGLVALAVVTPGLVAMQMIYGHFLPQSVIAKGARAAVPAWSVLEQLLAPEPISATIAVLGIAGAVIALRRGGAVRLLAAWLLLYLAAYALGGPKIWSWYSFMPLTACAILAGDALSRGAARWRAGGAFAMRYAVPAVVAAVVGFWAALGFWRVPDRITQNIYAPVAQFCAENATPADTILAADIGIIGYRCPGFIEDAAALVWPPAKDYASLWDIAAATKPTFLFLNVSGSMLATMARAPFVSLYRPTQRFAIDGVADPSQARNHSEDWAQEYIVYRRVDTP